MCYYLEEANQYERAVSAKVLGWEYAVPGIANRLVGMI